MASHSPRAGLCLTTPPERFWDADCQRCPRGGSKEAGRNRLSVSTSRNSALYACGCCIYFLSSVASAIFACWPALATAFINASAL